MYRTQLLLISCVIAITLVGCGQKPREGVYVNENHKSDFIELKPNSFYSKERGNEFAGKYELDEGSITFMGEGGRASRMQVKQDTLIDKDSDKWILWKDGRTGIEYERAYKEIQIKEKKLKIQDEFNKLFYSFAASAYQYKIHPKQIQFGLVQGGGGSYMGYDSSSPWVQLVNERLRSSMLLNYSDHLDIKDATITWVFTSRKGHSTVSATLDLNGKLSPIQYNGEIDDQVLGLSN